MYTDVEKATGMAKCNFIINPILYSSEGRTLEIRKQVNWDPSKGNKIKLEDGVYLIIKKRL